MDVNGSGFYNSRGNGGVARSLRILVLSGAVLSVASLWGCVPSSSMSESSESMSTSSRSSSKSSRSSSEESKEAYLNDVRHYTEAYTRSRVDVAGFTRGLSPIGEQYGIADWEADRLTYVGIGEGLAKGGLPQPQVDLYLTYLARGNAVKTAALREGLGVAR